MAIALIFYTTFPEKPPPTTGRYAYSPDMLGRLAFKSIHYRCVPHILGHDRQWPDRHYNRLQPGYLVFRQSRRLAVKRLALGSQ